MTSTQALPCVPANKTYQFAATAEECEILRIVRDAYGNITPPTTPVTHPRLNQPLQLTVKKEDGEFLGSCRIDAAHIVREFALAGAGFLRELLKERQPSNLDESVYISDPDSEESPEREIEKTFMSWAAVRRTVIPSCVERIKFTITEDATPAVLEQLQEQFPGVTIVIDGVISAGENAREEPEEEEAKIQQRKTKASTSPPKPAAVRRPSHKRSPRIPPLHTTLRRSSRNKPSPSRSTRIRARRGRV